MPIQKFTREIDRDEHGRLVSVKDRNAGSELLRVLQYELSTRRPNIVDVTLPCGPRRLTLCPDGTAYLVTNQEFAEALSTTATELRLNQRTGRLTYNDSFAGRTVVDIGPRDVYAGSGTSYYGELWRWFRADPRALPLLARLLVVGLFSDAFNGVGRALGAVMDRVYGAYSE